MPLRSVNWDSVRYRLDCGADLQGPVATQVFKVLYAQPTADVQLAIVMVACNAGAGTPPRVVYVFDGADSTNGPHLLQTLSDDGIASHALNRITGSVSAEGPNVTTTGSTYSSSSIPRCCPDGTFTSRWTWSGREYQQIP